MHAASKHCAVPVRHRHHVTPLLETTPQSNKTARISFCTEPPPTLPHSGSKLTACDNCNRVVLHTHCGSVGCTQHTHYRLLVGTPVVHASTKLPSDAARRRCCCCCCCCHWLLPPASAAAAAAAWMAAAASHHQVGPHHSVRPGTRLVLQLGPVYSMRQMQRPL
jgi:hypothetical protein